MNRLDLGYFSVHTYCVVNKYENKHEGINIQKSLQLSHAFNFLIALLHQFNVQQQIQECDQTMHTRHNGYVSPNILLSINEYLDHLSITLSINRFFGDFVFPALRRYCLLVRHFVFADFFR